MLFATCRGCAISPRTHPTKKLQFTLIAEGAVRRWCSLPNTRLSTLSPAEMLRALAQNR